MSSARRLRARARFEAALAVAALLLAALTLIEPEWIERVFAIDPDEGSGALEWIVVGVLVLLALASAVGARRDRQRLRDLAAHAASPA